MRSIARDPDRRLDTRRRGVSLHGENKRLCETKQRGPVSLVSEDRISIRFSNLTRQLASAPLTHSSHQQAAAARACVVHAQLQGQARAIVSTAPGRFRVQVVELDGELRKRRALFG